MMKTNGTYIFQSEIFSKKTNIFKFMTSESERELFKMFTLKMKEIYWTEKVMVKFLVKIIKNTTDIYLTLLLNLNLELTKNQITRIEYIFESLKIKLESKSCENLKVKLEEINNYIKQFEKGIFKDQIIMLNYQNILQLSIEKYDTSYAYAKSIGEAGAAYFLLESLNEKINFDLKISEINESNINSNIQDFF
jgi:ferritin-like metal-binding protein YciE